MCDSSLALISIYICNLSIAFEMSKSNPRQKSPYYGQPSNSRMPLRRYTQTKSTEEDYRKYHSSSRNIMK